MSLQRTFGIIKPDAVANGNTGNILALIEKNEFTIVGLRKLQLTQEQAEAFYAVHKARPFYAGLVKFMTEAPVVVMVLEKENAIAAWRDLMGATNPEKAADGTIRKLYATDIERNAVHGSDAPETAAVEIPFFFTELS
jgi:nucleoside-diphosphate kinase